MSDLAAVEVSAMPADKFREFLATRGMRLTPERETIVKEVFSSHDHFDAEELVARLPLSRATVYRTVKLLNESGLLRKVAHINDKDVYEHDYGYPRHDHLICQKCGELLEFHNDDIVRLVAEIAAKSGFRMTGHRLEVYGSCNQCSQPPQRRHNKLNFI